MFEDSIGAVRHRLGVVARLAEVPELDYGGRRDGRRHHFILTRNCEAIVARRVATAFRVA